jgi:hypothetical protein
VAISEQVAGTGPDFRHGPGAGRLGLETARIRRRRPLRYLGSARVQGNGDVAFSMKAALNGHYRAVFPAQGYFLASSAIAPS